MQDQVDKPDRARNTKGESRNEYPRVIYNDEMVYQCLQTTTFSHVVSKAPELRQVVSVRESSRSTSSRALGSWVVRGSSMIDLVDWDTV